jgi:uncharacterized protein (DUF362 family)/ferredoxin
LTRGKLPIAGYDLYCYHHSLTNLQFARANTFVQAPYVLPERYMTGTPIVAAAENDSYGAGLLRNVRCLLDRLEPSLPSQVKRGDRVLVKVNMGCTGAREPESRFTSHPAYVQAVIGALQDCGAKVFFGDDVARAGKRCESIYQRTGMRDVATYTGAELIDFVSAGVRQVRGHLRIPRNYLVTNAYFESDLVINVANCRSHQSIALSGAIKNMFGCVVGTRKLSVHTMFPGQPKAFSRVIADIYSTIPPDLSFLDLTTVVEGAGISPAVRAVGYILASRDGAALDTVAAHLIGYHELPLWIAEFANRFGVGCNVLEQIRIRGIDRDQIHKYRLMYPAMPHFQLSAYDRLTAIINNTVLRPRPVISPENCTECGDCVQRCPANCIEPGTQNHSYTIDLKKCVDCGCCLKVCEAGAVSLRFAGISKAVRQAIKRFPDVAPAMRPNPLDPAP